MNDRRLLEHINHEDGTICLYGKTHPLLENDFPTTTRRILTN